MCLVEPCPGGVGWQGQVHVDVLGPSTGVGSGEAVPQSRSHMLNLETTQGLELEDSTHHLCPG